MDILAGMNLLTIGLVILIYIFAREEKSNIK
jgi:hypothetical protein